MKSDTTGIGPVEVQAIDAHASLLMKRGIRFLGSVQPNAAGEALDCFARALELRRRLPIETSPLLQFGLAACWLNRGDALMRMGKPSRISLALRAYEEGIVLLRGLPLGDDVRFPRRLAIAYQNRALALQANGGSHSAGVIEAFMEAIATLDHEQAALIPDRKYLMAAVLLNLANARIAEATSKSDWLAREAALLAITLVAHLEAQDPDAAEVGLKARHVLCQSIARGLSLHTATDGIIADDVHQATDLADEGLKLIRLWEQKGLNRFRWVAHDLFRFGALVYEKYQPQFLREFVLENTDPSYSSIAYVESSEISSATRSLGF